jgi:hypothetical protein
MNNKYLIFGNKVNIKSSIPNLNVVLEKELAAYPSIEIDEPDIVINISSKRDYPSKQAINPKSHITVKNGFISKQKNWEIYYHKSDSNVIKVNIYLKHKLTIKKKLVKLINMQYSNLFEGFGQTLHELILIPLNYFDPNKFILHSSSFKSPKGKAIAIGGTGGVGKTSLELLFCYENQFQFLSDDIAVLDKNGYIYPNLSWPKIYGYNLENNIKLKKEIFNSQSLASKLHWSLHSRLRGANKVRRRINPTVSYSHEKDKTQLDYYFILNKGTESKLRLERISGEKSAQISIDIISAEYYVFHNQLEWHSYNSSVLETKPIVCLEEVKKNWKMNMLNVFNQINCFIIHIPQNISHTEFLDQIERMITDEIK